MTDRPLSIAEVLNEELEYLPGSSTTDRNVWQFVAKDVYDVGALLDKVRSGTPTRYKVLSPLLELSSASPDAVAEQLNGLLESEPLLDALLRDDEFAGANKDAIVWNNPKLLGGLVTNVAARRRFIEARAAATRFDFLLRHLDFLVDAVDEGPEIRQLFGRLRASDVARAVRLRPELFGTIVTSRAVRVALTESGAPKKLLNAVRCGGGLEKHDAADPARVLKELCVKNAEKAAPDGAMSARRVNALLIEAAFREHLHNHVDEKAAFERLHERDLVALCFSGGGIRSATFNLGVLQGLAKNGVLDHVNYMSTVSGGGYIGSWLSSWMRRHEHGTRGVLDELRTPPNDPVEPEPKPIVHLREYSHYLAPRAGIFTVDMWTLVGMYLRNLLLIWAVLLPPLIAVLALPRVFELLVLTATDPTKWFATGVGLLVVSTIAIGFLRPVRGRRTLATKSHFALFLVPGCLAAICFAIALARHWHRHGDTERAIEFHLFSRTFAVLAVVNVLSGIIYLIRYHRALAESDDPAKNALQKARSLAQKLKICWTSSSLGWKYVLEIAGPVVAAASGAGALALVVKALSSPMKERFPLAIDVPERFTIFAVPLLLFVLFAEAAALVGVVTKVSPDFDREWWARCAAMMSLGSVGWMAVCSLSLVGPALLLQLPKIVSATGALSMIVSAVAGFSKRTPAKAHRRSTRLILNAVATIAAIAALSGLSLLIDAFLPDAPEPKLRPARAESVNVIANVEAPAGYSLRVEEKPKEQSKLATALDPRPLTKQHVAKLRYRFAAPFLIALIEIALILAIVASILLDANDYSMHSMYRNRLIRAYLGASRWRREADRFTNFDPEDNVQMFQLRPHLLWRSSFTDFPAFLNALPHDAIYKLLPASVGTYVAEAQKSHVRAEELAPIILGSINQAMLLYDLETCLPARRTLSRLRRNRLYLEKKFDKLIDSARDDRTPLHILNITLNLVAGNNLAWQQRKAESFTVSTLHCGSGRLGFRDSVSYGGRRGISVGTAMAISGAAVSPNQGYNSSAVVTFIMTLLNARLGWWLGNPGPAGRDTWTFRGPDSAIEPLINEAFGLTDDRNRYVFLSDGGHFENLGLYEMVRRRCHHIIVCDAAADPKYEFGELGNAIRKIRVDFGIPIEFKRFCIGPDPTDPSKKREAAYCAIGAIDYGAVDSPRGGGKVVQGEILYIKPVVYADCPQDIKNYERTGPPFPQESTADQFFDETQFESYRALGAHIISKIGGDASDPSAFFTAARLYLTRHQIEHEC